MAAKKSDKRKEAPSGVEEPVPAYGASDPLTFEKVWLMFQETSKQFRETDRKFLETDRKFQETDKKFQETDKKIEALERSIRESRNKNDQDFERSRKEEEKRRKEMDRRLEESARQRDLAIQKLSSLFTSQWGKLIEAIIKPSCLKLFKERGIDVWKTYTNVLIEGKEREAEFDVVLANGTEVVIVEVKTTMVPADIDEFLEKLEKIRIFFPEYHDKQVFGAIAAIKYDRSSDRYAYKKGLYVLANSGEDIVRIANKENFVPRAF